MSFSSSGKLLASCFVYFGLNVGGNLLTSLLNCALGIECLILFWVFVSDEQQ